jgi:hypothetical protein
MMECLTCHGRYDTVQADGTLYFHRCPPLSVAELKAAIDSGAVQLPTPVADRLKAAQDADTTTPPKADELARADLVLAGVVVDRPNARDENVVGGRDPKTASQVKAAGAGRSVVP